MGRGAGRRSLTKTPRLGESFASRLRPAGLRRSQEGTAGRAQPATRAAWSVWPSHTMSHHYVPGRGQPVRCSPPRPWDARLVNPCSYAPISLFQRSTHVLMYLPISSTGGTRVFSQGVILSLTLSEYRVLVLVMPK